MCLFWNVVLQGLQSSVYFVPARYGFIWVDCLVVRAVVKLRMLYSSMLVFFGGGFCPHGPPSYMHTATPACWRRADCCVSPAMNTQNNYCSLLNLKLQQYVKGVISVASMPYHHEHVGRRHKSSARDRKIPPTPRLCLPILGAFFCSPLYLRHRATCDRRCCPVA